MAWTPTLPAGPPTVPGWWTELSFNRWVAGVVDEMQAERRRAERIERLRARCHEVDMKLAGVLSADRWGRIQQRRDQLGGAGLEVEHSAAAGRVLSVR